MEESMGLLELQCTFLAGLQLGGSHAEKRGDRSFLQVILLKPLFCLMGSLGKQSWVFR